MFFRKQLKWSTIQYTTFTTTLGFIGLFGQYIAVPILSGWLRLHDSTISLIDAVTRYVSLFLGLFTKKVCLQHKTEKIYKVHPYLLDGTSILKLHPSRNYITTYTIKKSGNIIAFYDTASNDFSSMISLSKKRV